MRLITTRQASINEGSMQAVSFPFLSNYKSQYHILYICLFWLKGHGSVTSAVREEKGNHLLCVK